MSAGFAAAAVAAPRTQKHNIGARVVARAQTPAAVGSSQASRASSSSSSARSAAAKSLGFFGSAAFDRVSSVKGQFCASDLASLSNAAKEAVELHGLPVIQAVADPSFSAPKRPGLIQHKKEAYWFYRFLSLVYDDFVNPFHWTVEMRDESLELAQLDGLRDKNPVVVDVGGGTGFTTEGIVKYINPENVTILDQSPHQLAKAREKAALQGCTIIEGDAEDLPFETDSCDRYTSAGSIEYWPEPQRGIAEAYRVVKPGGVATIIGPVRPTNWFSRFWADLWMLFPMEEEYRQWYEAAGFTDIKVKYITPKAYKGIREHGLIMGLTISGVKPQAGLPKIKLGPKAEKRVVEEKEESLVDKILFLPKFLLGCIAGLYYVVLPLIIIAYAALFVREPKKSA
eukprot:tig00000342_g24240.t1